MNVGPTPPPDFTGFTGTEQSDAAKAIKDGFAGQVENVTAVHEVEMSDGGTAKGITLQVKMGGRDYTVTTGDQAVINAILKDDTAKISAWANDVISMIQELDSQKTVSIAIGDKTIVHKGIVYQVCDLKALLENDKQAEKTMKGIANTISALEQTIAKGTKLLEEYSQNKTTEKEEEINAHFGKTMDLSGFDGTDDKSVIEDIMKEENKLLAENRDHLQKAKAAGKKKNEGMEDVMKFLRRFPSDRFTSTPGQPSLSLAANTPAPAPAPAPPSGRRARGGKVRTPAVGNGPTTRSQTKANQPTDTP